MHNITTLYFPLLMLDSIQLSAIFLVFKVTWSIQTLTINRSTKLYKNEI